MVRFDHDTLKLHFLSDDCVKIYICYIVFLTDLSNILVEVYHLPLNLQLTCRHWARCSFTLLSTTGMSMSYQCICTYVDLYCQTGPSAVRCANSNGVPMTSYSFMTSDGLTGVEDIHRVLNKALYYGIQAAIVIV